VKSDVVIIAAMASRFSKLNAARAAPQRRRAANHSQLFHPPWNSDITNSLFGQLS
jgi:hypothetical protein